jgi:hypothetical protein
VVSASPQPLYPRGRALVPMCIVQEADWVSGLVWMDPEILVPTGAQTPDHRIRSAPAVPTTLSRPETHIKQGYNHCNAEIRLFRK